jgi:hypothetical protein
MENKSGAAKLIFDRQTTNVTFGQEYARGLKFAEIELIS